MKMDVFLIISSFFVLLQARNVASDSSWVFNNQDSDDDNLWEGRWFPYSPDESDDQNPSFEFSKPDLYDDKHGVAMGIKDASCDDAETNLETDWNFDSVNYTCFYNQKKLYNTPRADIQPILTNHHIPKNYVAWHKCMNEPIEYNERIPTFGTHRPLWAKWGEYTFLPRQRWLHNLEHGGVAMLYHPCANGNEVSTLRVLVNKCLYRHVITPYTLLTPERPLALVTWGNSLEMSKVDPDVVIEFIRKYAKNGPEALSRDGHYQLMLKEHARIVTDLDDQELCKAYNYIQ